MYRFLAIASVLILGLGAPARSQFVQYTTPGGPNEPGQNAVEQARQAAADARWKIGPLRIQPHLSLGNLSYDQNAFSAPEGETQVNDLRATLGAGLAAYLRLGTKSVLSAYLAPEYSAWQRTDSLRKLGLNSGAAWFGDFNRLTVSAGARRTERETPLSTELAVPVQTSQEEVGFDSTLEITRRLAIFAIASDTSLRHDRDAEVFVPALDLSGLDRDGKRQVLGLELRGARFRVGLGYEETVVDFVNSDDRDNSGDGFAVRLEWERSRLRITSDYSELRLAFEDPDLAEGRRTVGSAQLAYRVRPETTFTGYHSDGLAFTVFSLSGIIETQNTGVVLTQTFGNRLQANVFGETATQEFIDRENPNRTDDIEAFGLGVNFQITERLTLTGRLRAEALDSVIDEFDRSTSSLGFGIKLGGNLLPW